jgi:hypothetical protein
MLGRTPRPGLFGAFLFNAPLTSKILLSEANVDALLIIYVWAQAHTTILLIAFFLTFLGVFFTRGKSNHNQNNIRKWG